MTSNDLILQGERVDMATTTKVPEFCCKKDQDVFKWAKRTKFILSLVQITGRTARKMIFEGLKGEAFEYAMYKCINSPDITAEDLLVSLEQRFIGKLFLTEVEKRFQEPKVPGTIEEYFKMIEDSKYLEERQYMSLETIADKIIARSPPEIRSILWSQKITINNVFDLSISAESFVPLAYGRAGLLSEVKEPVTEINRTSSYSRKPNPQAVDQNGNPKSCLIHGIGSHNSDNCKIILREKARFEKKRKYFNTAESKVDEEIKFSTYSLQCNKVPFKAKIQNPFQTEIIINGCGCPLVIF